MYEVTVTNGAELKPGEWVEMTFTLPRGRTGKKAGFYVGCWDDEGRSYFFFRDGHINGHKQSQFGFPCDHAPNHDYAAIPGECLFTSHT